MAHTIIFSPFRDEDEDEVRAPEVYSFSFSFSCTAELTDEGADFFADAHEDPEWPNVIT